MAGFGSRGWRSFAPERLRARFWPTVVVGALLELLAAVLFSGTEPGGYPGTSGSLGVLIAILAAMLAGPWAGLLVALCGWPLFYSLVAEGEPEALLALPLWIGGAVIAGLLSQRLRRTELEARTLAEEATHRLMRLETITEVALSHLDLDELLDELLERIRVLLGVDTATVLLRKADVLVPSASHGLEAELDAGVRIPVGQGFAGRIAAKRRPIVVDDVSEIEIANPLLRDEGLQSLLGVPLFHQGEVMGVVHVGTKDRRRFTPNDTLTLQLVADRVAMAIAQANLFAAERAARSEAEAAQERLRFLAEASELLASSLDYHSTLERVAKLAVPVLADEVLVDMALEGKIERVAVAHADPANERIREELARRYPPDPDASFGPAAVIKTGKAQVVSEITDEMLERMTRDEDHRRLVRSLGLRSFMTVPLVARDRVLGAISFLVSKSDRRYGPENLAFAQELARRAAAAIDNALLHAETEARARAALVLDHVGEGVFLVDRFGVVRLWNPAAEAITGLSADDVVGRLAAETIAGWRAIEDRVPVTSSPGPAQEQPETLPLDVGGREVWLLISGVSFPEGTVYAFRDVTQERGLRDLQAEFVATVSHELRTPLAAVYGAAMTLRQHSDGLDEADRELLLSVLYDEADRLSRIVDDVLWAARLDSGRLDFTVVRFAPGTVAEAAVAAARAHLPERVSIELTADESVPEIAADADRVRQVLGNLVENAVKYSPDGGTVRLRVEPRDGFVRFSVEDQGIGIPPQEQPRIFEKFYRLDPNQTRGVGGTGLGLYICRELVRRMNGRIWVSSREGEGSTFFVELPLLAEPAVEVLAHLEGQPGTIPSSSTSVKNARA